MVASAESQSPTPAPRKKAAARPAAPKSGKAARSPSAKPASKTAEQEPAIAPDKLPPPDADQEPPPSEPEPPIARVLAVHPDVATLRLIRETLAQLTYAEAETTPNPENAFDLALAKRYDLFIFALQMPRLPGDLLYDLIGRAYGHCHAGSRTSPAVLYITDAGTQPPADLLKDARVKGAISRPINIERLLAKGAPVLRRRPMEW